ncbi:MAG: bifunctional diaminohydroxyphosphoribosylaminopyrimidine deaminase/5-amino-6-(5-phosphoribosylamino)uracil reductase RibD [Acidobacteriota bacterium]
MKADRTSLSFDERMMAEALRLAKKGEGQVSPNPLVGAVVVKNGEVIARGYHRRVGEPHAEVIALAQAGDQARQSTLYVTLEPCAHQGRTPPCVDAIIKAGVGRVIAAFQDPNPLVNGAGFKRLREAGITVEKGCLEQKARELNEVFFTFTTRRRPFLIAKVAMSLDGKMATATGESRWISAGVSRHMSFKLRRSVDAIMVGVNTILADDPQLLRGPIRGLTLRPFTRVILDTELRTPPWAKILKTARAHPVLICCGRKTNPRRRVALEGKGATIVPCKERGGRVDLVAACEDLARREIASVVMEGGAEVLGTAFDQGLIDKVVFFIAPKIIGGSRALSPVAGRGAHLMSDAIQIADARWMRSGSDIVVVGHPRYGGR